MMAEQLGWAISVAAAWGLIARARARRRTALAAPTADVQSWTLPHTAGPLTADELATFFAEGYVIKRGLLSADALDGARRSVEGLVNGLAHRLHALGKISKLHESEPFERRLCHLEAQYPHASVLLHKNGVLPEGVRALWSDDAMTAVARQVLGDDLGAHPVWNLRCKTPETLSKGQATVPWQYTSSAWLERASRSGPSSGHDLPMRAAHAL